MFVISFNNNIGGQLIKLYNCTWRGLIKSGDSEGMEMTAGSLFKPRALYLDSLKSVNLKPHGPTHAHHTYTYSSAYISQIFHIQIYSN